MNDMREDFENRFNDRWEQGRRRWEEKWQHRSKHSHIWTGLFILIIGAAALVKATVTDLPTWLFSWPMFLIVLGLFSGVKHGFRGAAWFILMVVGGVFLYNEIIPDMHIRSYIWPVAIMAIGVFLIIRPRHRHHWESPVGQKKNAGTGIAEATVADGTTYDTYDTKEDYVDSTSFFGGAKRNVISKNFKGGDLVSIFGGTELDLTRADFTGVATLELTTIFGGTKLIVPSNWSIKSEVVTVFGGMEDKRNMQTLTDNPEKILRLSGTVIFGGIEIKSF
jgi:predicted membrane protein